MARSNSADFSVTGGDIVRGALRILGVYAPGETVSGDDMSTGIEALNMMVKVLMGQPAHMYPGLKPWQREKKAISIQVGTSQYEIYPGAVSPNLDADPPVTIKRATLQNSDGIESVLRKMSWEYYIELSNKSAEGTPTRYYYERKYDKGVIYFDMVPNETGYTLNLWYLRPLMDIDDLADDLDFPQQWFEPLKLLLAKRLAPEYGVVMQPGGNIDMLLRESLLMAQSFYPETTELYFQPYAED